MATKVAVATVAVTMTKERETKNTIRYAEDVADGDEPQVDTIYLPKSTLDGLGNPDRIILTVEAAA